MHSHSHNPKEFQCRFPMKPPSAAYCSLEQRRLIIAIGVNVAMMLIEFAGGWWSNSLALMSDAGHMLSDVFALGISYCAILLACKSPTESQSFGFYRAEILATLANGLTLIVVVVWILYEAWGRLQHPGAISGPRMLGIAAAGLIVNAITAYVLHDASHHNINVRSAFIHVLGDLGSSVGVVGAALVIWWTGWTPLDPILSALIAVVILWWSMKLLWEAVRILLQSTPRHLSQDRLRDALIEEVQEIRDVHHIHIWELTSHMYVLTAHVVIDDMQLSAVTDIRERACEVLARRFCITHADIQFETKGSHESDQQ